MCQFDNELRVPQLHTSRLQRIGERNYFWQSDPLKFWITR
jgi:hypothetical protein